MTKKSQHNRCLLAYCCHTLVGFGVVLVGVSFTPIGQKIAATYWTEEDSKALERFTNAYNRFSNQTPSRAGVSETEWNTQRERMKLHLEGMHNKLKHARRQSELWDRYFLWSGAVLAILGAVWHKLWLQRCQSLTEESNTDSMEKTSE